jgi:hypothetical protein
MHEYTEDDYGGNWNNPQTDCQLCQMDKRTDWYIETRDWIVAETLSGGPFVVVKAHTETLTDEQWRRMREIVGLVFDDFEITVLMNIVTDHWHGHIITSNDPTVKRY